jgi:hypothetical protein
MPNMVYFIDPDGTVIYRHNWGNPEELESVLKYLSLINTNQYASTLELKPWSYDTNVEMFKTVGRGGWDAIWDLSKAIPSVVWMHLKSDYVNSRKK